MKLTGLFLLLLLCVLLMAGCCRPYKSTGLDQITIEILPINDGSISPENQYDGCISINGKRHTWGELFEYLKVVSKNAPAKYKQNPMNYIGNPCDMPVVILAQQETPMMLVQFVLVYCLCVDNYLVNTYFGIAGEKPEDFVQVLLPGPIGKSGRDEEYEEEEEIEVEEEEEYIDEDDLDDGLDYGKGPDAIYISIFGSFCKGKEEWKINNTCVTDEIELATAFQKIKSSIPKSHKLIIWLDFSADFRFASALKLMRFAKEGSPDRMVLAPPRIPLKDWPKPLPDIFIFTPAN